MESNILRIFKNNKDYRNVMSSTILGSMVNWMMYICLLIIAGKITENGFQFGVLWFCSGLAPLFFSYILGVFTDLLDIKKILLFTEIGRISVLFGFFFLGLDASWLNWIIFFVLSFINGILSSLNTVSRQTIIPRMISEDDLTIANSFNFAIMSSSRLIGTAIGGVFFATFGFSNVLLISIIIYVISIAFIATIKKVKPSKILQKRSVVQNIISGKDLIKSYPLVKYVIFSAITGGLLVGSFSILIERFSKYIFKSGEQGVSFLFSTEGLVALIISLVIAERNLKFDKYYKYGYIYMLIGLAWAMFGFSTHLLIGMFVIGMYSFISSFVVPFERGIMQSSVNQEDVGKTFGLWNTTSLISVQIGTLLTGFLIIYIDLIYIPIIFGLLEVVFGMYLYHSLKAHNK
ncbi:MFS transporter [Mammaliicoccus sciuri]|uniref:MFS transporter n=1 Tax=Mammaliicoccus sciuri TaxID=1296 RepID=UPI00194EC75A|nr:MFS transporter [Mammaliicoccus sciuri]MEB6096064.1 MFS transporter [Mammaliicoccus sciuri]MEB8129138.1 MFS transporter [Mammaliicoccus sciuri]